MATRVTTTASVLDVASYILKKCGAMSAMKLQKLVYYAQAWSLVWDDEPLFHDRIEAWANGPVVPALYQRHKGSFIVQPRHIPGDPKRLNAQQRETVDVVSNFYGKKTSHYLSELTHKERPWKEAREGIPAGERGSREITHDALAEYYGGL